MSDLVTSRPGRNRALRHSVLGVAVAAALALPQLAMSAEFDTGSDDLSIRWDNTIRLNLVKRSASQDESYILNPNYDDGDRNFRQGKLFQRIDILSEFDLVWKKMLGFRVSGAGWYDYGYQSLDNKSVDTQNNLVRGMPALGLSPYTKRYARGPSGEWLDVFGFARFNVGDAPVNIKVGQTTVFWGESLYFAGAIHSIAYSQNPIDVWKALSTPGSEAKELFRPRVGFNIQSTVTNDLSIAAQYFFNWQQFSNQAWRYPESGTYLSVGDAALWGADSNITAPTPAAFRAQNPNIPKYLRLWHNKDEAITPEENSNNYGLAVRWSPEWLGGTLGGYYRRTYDMQPQQMGTVGLFPANLPKGTCVAIGGISLLPPTAPPATPGPCIVNPKATSRNDLLAYGKMGEYNLAFGDKIDIYALSLSKQVGGLSVGAELSYRQNMPLLSEAVYVLPAPLVPSVPGSIATTDVPKHGTPGALGDTMHGLLNVIGVIGETPVFDTANWGTELTWMTWLDVTQNEAVFKGRGNAKPGKWTAYNLIDAPDKNYFGLAINFTPTWFQVFPSVDILAPLSWSQGISGNSAVTSGGQDGAGSFGVGVAADIRSKYRIDFKYVGFYGDTSKCPRKAGVSPPTPATCVNGAVDIFNGTNAVLADRDFFALTFKTTF